MQTKSSLAVGFATLVVDAYRREQTGVDPRAQNLGGSHIPLGLAVHEGHIWMSYCSGRSVKVRKIAIQ
jgi:hypothetical protein